MFIKEALTNSNLKLQNYSNSPHLDSEVLLGFVLDKSREYLLTHPEEKINTEQISRFKKYIKQRQKNKPVAYITGTKEFYKRKFKVNKNVLIPRPDTEIIIDYLKNKNISATYCDIGTGSGAIAITLAKELSDDSTFIASDISKPALKLAKKNTELLFNLPQENHDNITFLHSNLWKTYNKFFYKHKKLAKNIVVIANLPYLEKKYIIADLKHEPKKALYASAKGLGLYKKLLQQISNSEFTPQLIALEALPEQMDKLKKLATKHLPAYTASLLPDLGGNNRYLILKK